MEKKRIIKLRTSQGLAKRIDFPKDFQDLIEKTKTFLPIDENTKQYQFFDEKESKEIKNQEDFELMSKFNENQKTIKILVNILDKEESVEEVPISRIFSEKKINEEESINLHLDIDDKQHEESDDKIKNDIKELVRNKMKDLEDNIVQDIYQSIKMQMTINEEKNNNINQNEIIHDNISCINCGMENIKGIRYKCLQCPNFNLCSNCEQNLEHDADHILIKIRKPLREESELLLKMKKDLKYKNSEYNYSINKKDFKFNIEDKEKDIIMEQITLKNNGTEPWKSGAIFKCLPDSQLKGNDFKIECKVNKEATINIEIIFDNLKEYLINSVNEYFVYYQMFNPNNEAFGNISKFRVIFQN